MDENALVVRVVVALLFAIAFTLVGWTAPILYATHAPQSQFIEVNEFTAQNVSADADMHYLCLNRQIHEETTATIYTELYLLNGDSKRVEVSLNDAMDRHLQKGGEMVITPMDLSPNLEPGKYQYLLVVQMDLAEGWVERSFAFDSEPFTIGPNQTDDPSRKNVHCPG